MRTTPRVIRILFILVMGCSAGTQPAALGQSVKLTLPEDDHCQNAVPTSIAFSPDGNLVATGHGVLSGMLSKGEKGETVLWDARSGKRLTTIPAVMDGIRSIAFSPNGKSLAVLEYTGVIRLISVPEGRELRKFETNRQDRAYYSVAFFPNGEQLAVGVAAEPGSPGNVILIFDLASGRQIRTLAGHRGPVASVAVSPDGKLLASGAWDGTARIWNALTGKPLETLTFPSLKKKLKERLKLGEEELEGLGPWVQSVAFSPDSRTLAAAASFDDIGAEVQVWEISTAKSKATLTGIDAGLFWQTVFSPDGRTLATAVVGGSTGFWDTSTFKKTGAIERCFAIAFSPDGKTIAASTGLRTVAIQKAPGADRR